jgi:hypothetical protein
MLVRHLIPFSRVEIIYRFPQLLPLRFELRPGVWATFSLSTNQYCHYRAELLASTDRDPRGILVHHWPDMDTAEFYCRHGVTLEYESKWPSVFRPAVRARVVEIVIGPHVRLPYADLNVVDRCPWPVPKRDIFNFLHPEGLARRQKERSEPG